MTSLVFFGNSEYSLIILERLLTSSEFSVKLVVTKTDKPFGRNQTITPNPVAKYAVDKHLPLLQIDSFSPAVKLEIRNFKLEIGLCVAFGPPYFDQETIDIFPRGIINIHPSSLPQYRGATPGPWQIINGETSSAITFFKIDHLPDHGPIIAQVPFDISTKETSESFYQKAFSLAANNINLILSTDSIPQDHTQKSYFPKLTKEMAQINWNWDPQKIDRFVRAMIPWPIAWTFITDKNGQKLKMKVFSSTLRPEKVLIEGKKLTFWSEISSHYSIIK